MKVSRALKLKNKLAGEVAHFKAFLLAQNARPVKQPFDYNNAEVLANLRARLHELVKVKTAIAVVNSAIYEKIFQLAELKGPIAKLNELDTRQGIIVDHDHYRERAEVEYVAQIKKVEVDRLVAELQGQIQSIQEELDEFNHTHSVDL